MAPHLFVVEAKASVKAAVEAPQAALGSGRPQVLTPECVSRLSAMNRVARRLRELGYQVWSETVSPEDGGNCPQLCVRAGRAGSMRALQNLAGAVVDDRVHGVRYASIDGVRVQLGALQ